MYLQNCINVIIDLIYTGFAELWRTERGEKYKLKIYHQWDSNPRSTVSGTYSSVLDPSTIQINV